MRALSFCRLGDYWGSICMYDLKVEMMVCKVLYSCSITWASPFGAWSPLLRWCPVLSTSASHPKSSAGKADNQQLYFRFLHCIFYYPMKWHSNLVNTANGANIAYMRVLQHVHKAYRWLLRWQMLQDIERTETTFISSATVLSFGHHEFDSRDITCTVLNILKQLTDVLTYKKRQETGFTRLNFWTCLMRSWLISASVQLLYPE